MVQAVPTAKVAPVSAWVAIVAWAEDKETRRRCMFVTGSSLVEAYEAAAKEVKAKEVVVGVVMAAFAS